MRILRIGRHGDLFLGYLSFFATDFDNVTLLLLQIGLNTDEDVALLVDRDAFDVFQLPAKGCDGFRLFAWRVDIELAIVTIRDVERPFRKVNRLRSKRFATIDNAV